MTRRPVLLALVALAASLSGIWWIRRGDVRDVARRLAAAAPRDGAAAVGRSALQALPAGTRAEHLVLAIAQALDADPAVIAEMSEHELRARLRDRVAAEHRSGETLSVDGWELALTEARLYALATAM